MKHRASIFLFFFILFAISAFNAQAQTYPSWQDSLSAKDGGDESSLQFLLDSLGYDIDVEEDELGLEVFCVSNSENFARMILEVAYAAPNTKSGYHKAGDTSNRYQLFSGSDTPGDAVDFTVEGFNSIGFYIYPKIENIFRYWYTETGFNSDDFDHALVFATGIPNQYLICWEDLPNGGDKDFQDLVLKVKLPNHPPSINCPTSLTFSNCTSTGQICFGVSADDEDSDPLYFEILEGSASVEGNTVCLNSTEAGEYQIKIVVFDVCGKSDTCQVLVEVTSGGFSGTVECPNDTSIFSIGENEQVCIPGFVCQFNSCYVYPSEIFNLSENAVCFYPDTSGIYTVHFVAIDSCGGRDTCSTKIHIEKQTGTCDSIKVTNHFTLEFEGVTYDSESGTSKWDYKLWWDGTPPELSYFFIELCTLITNENLVSVDPDYGTIGFNGNADLWGIKWDDINGTPAETPIYFSFTLDQQLTEADILFAPKAGVNQNLATICGPSKDCDLIVDSCENNKPPVTDCPNDTTIIVNDLSELCLTGFEAIDPDGNLALITVEGGSFENGTVCFVPIEGANVLTLIASDSCQLKDTCRTTVLIRKKSPPVCQLPPGNSTIQICAGQDTCLVVTAFDPDNDLVGCSITSGPGEIRDDTLWCYTPLGNETVTVEIECLDSTGLTCSGSFTVEFIVANPPVIGEVEVTDVFLCSSEQPVCVDLSINNYGNPFTISTQLGEFNPQDSSICFTADTSGTYCNRVIVTNACGQADTVEYCVEVVINSAPVATCPESATIFACQLEGQVCISGFGYFDADLNYEIVSVIGGTLYGDSVCIVATEGDHLIELIVSDECGLADTCQTIVTVRTNRSPQIVALEDRQASLCIEDTLCYGINIIDQDNNLDSVWSNYGKNENGVLCFNADSVGTYLIIVNAVDLCGATDIDSFNVVVNLNQPPVVTIGEDFSTQLCGENGVCVPFEVSDINLISVTSNFQISGDSVCFTADTSGTYLLWVRAMDDCERVAADTIWVTVSAPPAPFVSLGDDLRATICSPTEFCIDVATIDNPASIIFNRVGYNPETGQFCFTASQSILDLLRVTVTDSCSRTATDSISVYIQLNTAPKVQVAMPDTTIYLCQPSYVCLPLVFADSQNNIINVSVNRGNYSNGQVCFVPYDKGEYIIIATATDSCGLVTADTAVVTVITDQFVNLDCPNDTTVFMCEHDTMCFPIGEIPEWAEVHTTGINTWFDREKQQVCFYVTCGVSNRITVTTTTACGTFSCEFTVNVVCNQPPVVFLPPDTIVQLCASDSIYIPVGINDPNNNLHSVNVSSWAVYEPISSRIAFSADTSGTYILNVFAYDSCEASASDQIRIQVSIAASPVCYVPNDTIIYLCQPRLVTLPIFPPGDSILSSVCEVVEGPGEIGESYWSYQANSAGVLEVVVECTDDCENICRDTFIVDIRMNSAPVCSIPNDTLINQCQPTEICLPISAIDEDGNFKSCSIIRGPGSVLNPVKKVDEQRHASSVNSVLEWCYTPTKDTSFYVVVQCEDSCKASCIDSFNFTIDLNEAPVVNCPGDTTLTLCSLEPVSVAGFTASDPNGDELSVSISQGELVGNTVTFTPVQGPNTLILGAYDDCETYAACTTVVTVDLNEPPICLLPRDTVITGCTESQICLPVSATDPDGNLVNCEVVDGPGVVENGYWCLSPVQNGTYQVFITCIDACGFGCTGVFTVEINSGTPPAIVNQYFANKFCDDVSQRVLQFEASQSENDPTIFEILQGSGSIDSLSGIITYLPDTPGVYGFVVEVSNSCGSNSAIVYDTVKINRPPEIIGFDSTVYLCQIKEICFDVFGFDSDLDSLNILQIIGSGAFTQQTKNTGKTCFTPSGNDSISTYLFVYQVTDLCRDNGEGPFEFYYDTVAITVILDQPPVLNIPPFFTIFACNPDSACFRIPPHSPEEFPYEVEVLSGNAVVYGDTVACLLIDGAGDYDVTIRVIDSCGNSSTYTSTIHVEVNAAPQIIVDADFSILGCDPNKICFDINTSDINDNIKQIYTSLGNVDTDFHHVCFSSDTTGVYSIVVSVVDSCDATDSDTINITVYPNQIPNVSLGADFTLSICSTQMICIPFQLFDDNLDDVGSNVDISGDSLCFVVDTAGTYLVWLQATDECSIVIRDSVLVTVTTPPAPFVSIGNDIRATICSPTEFCIDVETIDNPASVVFNRVGYNPETRQFCWTANETILDLLKVTVTDSCGRTATDSITVYVKFNTPPKVQVAMRDTTVYFCQPNYVCLPVVFADSQNNIASIQVNRGQYSNGQVCFVPYDSGTYTIIATATDSCGAISADTAVVRVLTDQYVDLDCPNDTTVFMCTHDTLCFPIGEIPDWAQVQVTGINTWHDAENSQVCFYVTCGVRNHIVVKATTPCGNKTCSFNVTVQCNQPPFVTLPPDTSISICGPDSVRIPVGISDPNNNIVSIIPNSWSTFEPITSRVVFYADTAGDYRVQVTAIDSCGAQDSEDILVNVWFNTAPQISFAPADSVYDLCVNQVICLPITFSDAENNITQIIPSIGTYNPNTQQLCFQPGDTSGLYCVSITAIDACGLAYTASKCITLNNQGVVDIDCPSEPIYDTLCTEGTICYALSILGSPDSIKVNYGQYFDGQLCFGADTSGIYNISISVFSPCTTLTCQTQFRVTIVPDVQVLCPNNDTVSVCIADTVYYSYASVSATSFSITPPAFVTGSQIGLPILTAGVYNLTLIGSGACGADTCAFFVDARMNSKPVVVSARDTTLTDCVIQQFCIPFTVTDPNNNVASVVGPNGPLTGNQYCFTPTGSGDYRIIITATDSCGATGADTTMVRVQQSAADIFCPTGTQTRTVCRGDSVRITVPIIPFEAVVQVYLDGILNGFYNRDSALAIVFPQTPGSHTLRLIASAGCVTDTCNISLFVNFLELTAISCPAVIDTFLCPVDVDSICFPVTVIGTSVQVSVNNGGKYSNGQVCVPIYQDGSLNIRMIATGACGVDTCMTTINVIADDPPTLHLPADTVIELCDFDSSVICIGGIYVEDDSPASLTKICGPGTFTKTSTDSGFICFFPSGDFFGDYIFCFEVNDGCNARIDTFKVTLLEGPQCDLCLSLSIDGGECVTVGSIKKVQLEIESLRPIGGFEVLLSFDASVSAVSVAQISGTEIDGWEYFNYRLNSGACAPVCPSGLLRLVGLAEANNGGSHPPASSLMPNGVLVDIYFMITNDQNVGGQFIPIRFVTYECADNTFSDPTGNDLFVDNKIYNSENVLIWDEENNSQYPETGRQNGLGTPDSCIVGVGKGNPKRCVEYFNGGICILHPDDIDDRGDINFNGLAYEVADAVLFTNYFIYGLQVFTINIQGQMAATDINADGRVLTVADLVYLLRILIDDANPIPKINPHESDLQLIHSLENGVMTVSGESVAGIGGAYLVYSLKDTRLTGDPNLSSASGQMEIRHHVEDDELRILIYSMNGHKVEAGSQQLVNIPFDGGLPVLTKSDFADPEGRPYNLAMKGSELPTGFELNQNYPNPFNPSTTLSFRLPIKSDWRLTVFNVGGATVKEFNGSDAPGLVEIIWDGRAENGGEIASGVYFYKLEAGSFSQTKKMIMLK